MTTVVYAFSNRLSVLHRENLFLNLMALSLTGAVQKARIIFTTKTLRTYRGHRLQTKLMRLSKQLNFTTQSHRDTEEILRKK